MRIIFIKLILIDIINIILSIIIYKLKIIIIVTNYMKFLRFFNILTQNISSNYIEKIIFNISDGKIN